MTHQDPQVTQVQRSNLTMLLTVLVAALIAVPLMIWWMWADDAGQGTIVAPDSQTGVEQVLDPATTPAPDLADPLIEDGTPGAPLPPPAIDAEGATEGDAATGTP